MAALADLAAGATVQRRITESDAASRRGGSGSNTTSDGSDSDLDLEAGIRQSEAAQESGPLLQPSKARSSPGVVHIHATAGQQAAPSIRQQRPEDGPLELLKSMIAVVVWYTSNIGLLLLNKFMLSGFGFKRPVFLTLWHMIACTLLSGLLAAMGAVPVQHITSARQFGKVSVLALVFCASVVLGNVSLRYIPVSFNQAIGATTPLFTAVLALIMIRQQETARVYLTLVPVVVGIVIATGAEPSFHLIGFVAAVVATSARAFKSILQGLLLTDPAEKLDSMNLLRYMTPIASAALMLLVAVVEPDVGASLPKLGDPNWVTFYLILGANGTLAFLVNLTNFLVTRYTSALTLQVLGNAKGVIAALVSIMVFGNAWTVSSMGGYGIATMGVAWFMHEKKMAKAAKVASSPVPHTTTYKR